MQRGGHALLNLTPSGFKICAGCLCKAPLVSLISIFSVGADPRVMQFILSLPGAWGINVIDNALIGSPSVQCGPEHVEISAKTERPFEGVVYIKDWRRADGCYSNSLVNVTGLISEPRLAVPLNDLSRCGMEMKRKPETGEVVIRGIFVFSFHPMFVTKVDRAYAVHCIFRQKEFTVTSKFSVNDFVTKGVISRTASMPTVNMKIVSGTSQVPDISLPPVSTVKVGDPVLFIWNLPTQSDMFGVRIRDCTAENKKGARVKILEDGCTMDEVAISNVGYTREQDRAFATAHAFKFADNEDMWFKCTVSICIKFHPNDTSSDLLDESCDKIKACNASGRYKRDLSLQQAPLDRVDSDLLEERLTVLDAYNENQTRSEDKLMSDLTAKRISLYSKQPTVKKVRKPTAWVVCMRKPIFALVSSIVLLMYITTFILATIAIVVYCRRKYGESYFKADPSKIDY